MPQYDVLVSATATVYKVMRVEADDEDTARAQATTEAEGLQSTDFQTTAENANGMEDYSVSNVTAMTATEATETETEASGESSEAAPKPKPAPKKPAETAAERKPLSFGFDF